MKLTVVERWMLSNQYRILEKLYPDEAEDLANSREAIEKGYELDYPDAAQHIYEKTFSHDDCREVLDILGMFQALKHNYERLEDKTGIDTYQIKFHGFDGNNESSQLAYAWYFCEQPNKRFVTLDRTDNFNSHMPTLKRYRRMLTQWNESKDKNELTKEDIIRITKAE